MSLQTPLSPEITDLLKRFNLTQAEYRKITTHLGRDPNFNELAMFSVLWSEHCCYKNSRHLLKKLPTKGKRVVQGPGENAGIIDIGDGIQIAFKIESHNHPTAVEPFQGATTGVGGILRDIFTMNARPIANLNSLRFGPGIGLDAAAQENISDNTRNRYLFSQAVAGIAHYGNCTGVPTIGGEIFFDDCYSQNPLVNAMSIGVLYDNQVMPSGAKGIGNPVLYVGSATGKDGMGGAAFASRELDGKSHEDRPAVQVGDPFYEKLLIEACLEAFRTGCVISAQDMGAAGLTCALSEMAAKGGVGMHAVLDKVPAREPNMAAFEYLLSESQERMLLVLEKGKEQPVLDIFSKWRLPAVIIGEIIAEERVLIDYQGERVVDLPAQLLTNLAPSYERTGIPKEPEAAKSLRTRDPQADFPDIHPAEILLWVEKMCASPNIAQPGFIFHQYDRHVQNGTVVSSENNASGVIRIRQQDGAFSGKALAATTDCNARYVYLEPYAGTMSAVVQAARNLACVGAEPLAVTDNLNFGNPEKDDIYYQLYYAIQGIRESCEVLETPVTGGNVSLYNEHSGKAIFPTPVIGMVGLVEDDSLTMTPSFKQPGDRIALIGRFKPTLGGSEFLALKTGEVYGPPPEVSLRDEKLLIQWVLRQIRAQTVHSVQDVSMGGLLMTLLECAFTASRPLGIQLDLSVLEDSVTSGLRWDRLLFGETNGAYIISYNPAYETTLLRQCEASAHQPDHQPEHPIDQSPDRIAFVPLGAVIEEPLLKIWNMTERTANLSKLREHWRTALNHE